MNIDPTIRRQLDEIRDITPDLNKMADELFAFFAEIEKELEESKIGVRAITSPLSGGTSEEWTILAYGRIKERFRIYVARIIRNEDGTVVEDFDERKLLENCSRAIRIEAASKIEELLAAIQTNARAMIDRFRTLKAEHDRTATPKGTD